MTEIKPPIPGVMGTVELVDNNTKIKKTYIEIREITNIPSLLTIGDKVYTYTSITEHEAHETLYKHFPDKYPKIYEYKETKYLDLPEAERPRINKVCQNFGGNEHNIYICVVVMDFVNKPNLRDVLTEQLQTPQQAINFLKLWFKNLLDMVKVCHIQPNDFHAANILTDLPNDILFIDYGWYRKFEPIDEIDSNNNYHYIGWKIDPTTKQITKKSVITGHEELFKPKQITMTDEDAELMLFDIMRYELKRSLYNSIHNVIYLLFQDQMIDLFKQAMKELKLGQKFQSLVLSSLTNGRLFKSIYDSVENWLGFKDNNHVSIHRILRCKMTEPDKYLEYERKWTIDYHLIPEIKKLSKNELFEYFKSHKEITRTERDLICCLYYNYNPWFEQAHIYSYIIKNQQVVSLLYRLEYTNRFNDNDDKLTVGQMFSWSNYTSMTTIKEYALSFADDRLHSNGDNDDDSNKKNYLFVIHNAKAAHMKRAGDNFTTHYSSYNHENPDDNNWMNWDIINIVLVADEYLANINNVYEITSIKHNQKSTFQELGKNIEITYELVEMKLK